MTSGSSRFMSHAFVSRMSHEDVCHALEVTASTHTQLHSVESAQALTRSSHVASLKRLLPTFACGIGEWLRCANSPLANLLGNSNQLVTSLQLRSSSERGTATSPEQGHASVSEYVH